MLKILTNTHINRYRKSTRSPSTIGWDDLPDGSQRHMALEAAQDPLPEDVVLELVPDEEVGPALAGLPDEFREAVILSDLHDMSYKEIAQVLRIPLGTVRSRIFRGRRLLRQKLENYAQARGMI
jgi:RNA polymerase sigma-70 factor (ECF subfamily)